jgi:N-acetylglucosamine-6-sulfatase
MRLRLHLATAVAGLAATVGAGTALAQDQGGGDTPRPNVIVVMTDDQHQASLAKMPRVNSELVAGGTTFSNSFTNWPVCCPSRATFYSGQYAHNHRVLGNSPPDGGFARFNDDEALPVWLQRSGYRTIHIGKYLNGYGEGANDPAYVPPGWNEWYAPTAGTTQSVYDYTLNQNGTLVDRGSAVTDFKQDVFTEIAVDAINRHAPGGPFFMGVMYTAPHSGGPNPNPHPPSNCNAAPKPAPRHATAFDAEPLPTPPNFNEADVSDKPAAIQSMPVIDDAGFANIQRRYRCRLESLLSVDDGVGRIVDALAAADELDNTLIAFTSDNGFFHGEHRIQTGKNRVYEEAARVPLVIRGLGVPAGVTIDELAVNADLTSAVLDAAETSPGLTQDGRSLLSLAEHPARYRGRELLLEKGDVLEDDGDDTPQSGSFAAIRTHRYVYVDNGTGELELYDLRADPHQLVNQVTNPAYDLAEGALAKRLATLRACAGESCKTKPALRLDLPRSVREDGRSCRPPGRFVVHVRGADSGATERVRFLVGSKRAGHDDDNPLKKKLRPRLLRDKHRVQVRAIAELVDGRILSLQREVRVCR